jgi:hypothetical protein
MASSAAPSPHPPPNLWRKSRCSTHHALAQAAHVDARRDVRGGARFADGPLHVGVERWGRRYIPSLLRAELRLGEPLD